MSRVFVGTAGLEGAPLEDGAVLYYPKSGAFILLNRTAAHLWAALATPKTEEELVQSLCAVFSDVTLPTAQRDVSDLLEQLQEMELVSARVGCDVHSG